MQPKQTMRLTETDHAIYFSQSHGLFIKRYKIFVNYVGTSHEGRLATLRYKPFRYNGKSQYGTGIYKRTKDVTVHNNHFGIIQQKH